MWFAHGAVFLALAGGMPSLAVSQGGTLMNAAATVTLVGTRPGRPPLERLLVDVTLSNDGGVPRWALIPTNLPRSQGGIDKLEQLTVGAGATRVAIEIGRAHV